MADQIAQQTDPAAGSVTPFYLDKALWVTFLAPVFAILNAKFGLSLDAAEISGMVLPVVVYIVMHKYKSSAIVVANIQAQAQKDQAALKAQASSSPDAAAAALAGIK